MTSIILTVTGAQAQASVSGTLTSGMVGIPVTINYDDSWEGVTKNLVCRCCRGADSAEHRTILNVGNTAVVAHEVMKAGMILYLGVEGCSADGKLVIPTTWAMCGIIEKGANTGEDLSANPMLPVWGQLQTEIEKIKQDAVTSEQMTDILSGIQSTAQAAALYANRAEAAAKRAEEAATGTEPGSGGLNATAVNLLVTILRNSVYSTDQSANITALENAFASGGNSGGEEPENPDEPIAPEVTLSSISAVYSGGSAPAGTAVSELTGIVVTAHYSDGSSAIVTGYTLSGEIAEGENTITVTYQGKTATFTVTGVEESSGGEGNIVDAWAYYEWDVGYRIYGASGKDVQNGDKYATTKEYISTENVEKIVVSAEGAGGLHQMGVFFFDEAEGIVSNVGGYISANNASYPTPVEIEIPEGAAYFRLTTMDKASLDGTIEKILKYSVYLK